METSTRKENTLVLFVSYCGSERVASPRLE